MATTTANVTDTYTLIVADGSWISVQNRGVSDVDAYIGTSLPADTVEGFILKPLDMMLPDTFGSGNVYMKTRKSNDESTVAIGL